MGKCGQIKCQPRGSKIDNCSLNVEHNYKFYLSFENSVCKEYVTEKLFDRLRQNVVPVVMGSGPYNNGFTPPHTVIDYTDFDTPHQLAQFLLWLDKHPEEYLSYFWWQDYYMVKSSSKQDIACELCRKLHSKEEPRTVYKHLYDWWVKDGQCTTWSKKLTQHKQYRHAQNQTL